MILLLGYKAKTLLIGGMDAAKKLAFLITLNRYVKILTWMLVKCKVLYMSEEYVLPVIAASVAANGVDGTLTEARRPKEAVLALERLCQGWTFNEIREETGLSFNAISSLKARNEVAMDVRRQQLAADGFEMAEKLRLLVGKKADMLANDDAALKRVNIRDLVLPYGIAMDKALQSLGEAKVVVEHRSGKPSLEDAIAAINAAKASLVKDAIPVDSFVVPPNNPA
jgi:hypothetical protein